MTGASSGIGRAIAEAYAAEGAEVLLTHRASPERARDGRRRRSRRAAGARTSRQADLATRAGVRAPGRRGARAARPGSTSGSTTPAPTCSPARRRSGSGSASSTSLLAVDLKGTIACSYAAGEVMRERGGDDRQHELGSRRRRAWPARTRSCSRRSRAACWRSARASRAAWRPTCASTSCARAGSRPASASRPIASFTARSRRDTPLGRWGRPQDVADAALYLASPEAAFVTGQAINVNGGVVM